MSAADLVKLTIDGQTVEVPKGTTIIEAAKKIATEIPHYCYHPSLSIVGNCRMCQVEVEGPRGPMMMIACHAQVQPDMVVRTHLTSEKVQKTQADTLELILINHPLDCTVCDQAGHCKLQDYHFEYNNEESRFVEDKVKKVKAKPLGPTVMLDGERCIMCTRCVRFCDEVTGTSEIGMVNRGDKSMITVHPDQELNNPLSGNVVDLCPVGALTHRQWRFNTRIWYTKQTNSVCTGCSSACNVNVAVRDRQIVQVKGRAQNEDPGWLCDEGRYGFNRFTTDSPLGGVYFEQQLCEFSDLLKDLKSPLKKFKGQKGLFMLSPDLLLEDYFAVKTYIEKFAPESAVGLAYRKRQLTEVEKIVISPDYAFNYRSAVHLGLVGEGQLEEQYETALNDLRSGKYDYLYLIGDRAILKEDCTPEILSAVRETLHSVALVSNDQVAFAGVAKINLPVKTILEKNGLMISSKKEVKYLNAVLNAAAGAQNEFAYFNDLALAFGSKLLEMTESERQVSTEVLSRLEQKFTIKEIKAGQCLI